MQHALYGGKRNLVSGAIRLRQALPIPDVSIIGHNHNYGKMMKNKNLDLKTGLTRKGGVFTGAAMALAAVMAMAPTSQAFAYQQAAVGFFRGGYEIEFLGQGKTSDAAKRDAMRNAGCSNGGTQTSAKITKVIPLYNKTWYNATYKVTCSTGTGSTKGADRSGPGT